MRPVLAAVLFAAFGLLPVSPASASGERIVAIGGAITEILYALGEEERIVGVDTTSLHPPQALAEKPNVGYMRALSAEGVLALGPDLILMDEGAGPPEAVDLLLSAGVAVERVPTGHSVPELVQKVRRVADAVGKGGAGAAMAAEIETEFAALERETTPIERPRRVLFILSMNDGRPNAAGSGTGADAVIRLAGGENVLADTQGYRVLSAEAAAALGPDVILVLDRAGSPNAPDPLAMPALRATPAGERGAVIRMDAAYLLGFGPRTPEAARELAHRLYPENGFLAAEPNVR